jgi:glucose-1-phosphatase
VPDPSVKNIIFDLGGVILDLSVTDTLKSFSKLSGLSFKEIERIFISAPEFEHYEKGSLDDAGFRHFIRQTYRVDCSDADIDACWNAMLLDLPAKKLQLLENLKSRYNTFLLSNTNGIHLDYINQVILPKAAGIVSLDKYFHRSYYSHRMGKRKPDAEIFEQVLEENNLNASETLFLDDNGLNTEGAAKVGIKTIYITSSDQIFDVFR